jgi:hypothetical protein
MHSEGLNFVISAMLCRSMTRAERTVEVHGLQIWSVAANVLNEQVRTAEMGWVSSKIG